MLTETDDVKESSKGDGNEKPIIREADSTEPKSTTSEKLKSEVAVVSVIFNKYDKFLM